MLDKTKLWQCQFQFLAIFLLYFEFQFTKTHFLDNQVVQKPYYLIKLKLFIFRKLENTHSL